MSYNFISYPFSQLGGVQLPLPPRDPLTLGKRDPSGGNSGFPPNQTVVDPEDHTVLAPLTFGQGTSGSMSWPPMSIFDNISYWNTPLAYTFQVFRNHNPSTWYPLNFFSISDPTSKIPLVPVDISWAAVPGAATYRFRLDTLANALRVDTNLPQPIDVHIASPRHFQFTGRGSVLYHWEAAPLDGAGAPILGDPIVKPSVILFTQPSVTLPQGRYDYGWDVIPGAVRYEIQYAVSFADIPAGTPFADLATFTENTVTGMGTPGAAIIQTAHVLGTNNCSNCALRSQDDLDPVTPGFQYDFAHGVLAQLSTNGNAHLGVRWRVRGIDAGGQVVRNTVVQSGEVEPPLPSTPYQSANLTWPLVPDATSYLIDIVENVADFARLPALTEASGPKGPVAVARDRPGSGAVAAPRGAATQAARGAATPADQGTPGAGKVFLVRRVVADYRPTAYHPGYEAGPLTVNKFKHLLMQARVYVGEAYRAAGFYDGDPTQRILLDDQVRLATNNFTSFPQSVLDGYYPRVADDVGMTVNTKSDQPSLSWNQIQLTTASPITITDQSTGQAKLLVTQTNGKKTTTLTFTTNGGPNSSGTYVFQITKDVNVPLAIKYGLTYGEFGPLPVIGDLTGKGYAEFNRLLPNQTYYWRVRALKDPQIGNPGSTDGLTWYAWSGVDSFTTPSGVPTLVSSGSTTTLQIQDEQAIQLTPAMRRTLETKALRLGPLTQIKRR